MLDCRVVEVDLCKGQPSREAPGFPSVADQPQFLQPSLSLPPQQIVEPATAAVVLWNIMARGVSPHREVTQY